MADEYNLRRPSGEDESLSNRAEDQWVFKAKRDKAGNVEIGQFDMKTDERCGIIRRIDAAGTSLSE